ncbi:enhancer of rudimentary homolog [Anopheles funestus]|uniref:enhancer of rudimentary homolog n=1 Tax=Anopheles funestus TaxID=62324 RepID=UPI0020C5DD35|nr:enhancer of rudimentary homolog [Anopheles funestus]
MSSLIVHEAALWVATVIPICMQRQIAKQSGEKIFGIFFIEKVFCRFYIVHAKSSISNLNHQEITIIMAHTILLLQLNSEPTSRTYMDFESVSKCVQGIRLIYEKYLQGDNDGNPEIGCSYNQNQLNAFIDEFFDISCLVYVSESNSYVPRNKEWIKMKIFFAMN